MSRRQRLRRVPIQDAVVNLEREGDDAAIRNTGLLRRNLRVRKEEGHCGHGANHHGVPASQDAAVRHVAAQHGARDAAYLDESIVAPRLVRARDAKLHAPAGEVVGQEDVEQGIRQADDGPRQPEQHGSLGHLAGGEQGAGVDGKLAQGEAAAGVGEADGAAGLELLDAEGAGPPVPRRQLREHADHLGVLALSQEELGRFAEPDDGDAERAEEQDEPAHGVHEVSPPAVVPSRAVACGRAGEGGCVSRPNIKVRKGKAVRNEGGAAERSRM